MKPETESALQNLRAECARTIDLSFDAKGPWPDTSVMAYFTAIYERDAHFRRALLLAVAALERIHPDTHGSYIQVCVCAKQALDAIAAEFAVDGQP